MAEHSRRGRRFGRRIEASWFILAISLATGWLLHPLSIASEDDARDAFEREQLVTEMRLLEARETLARESEPSLTVDVPGGWIALEIGGVPVRVCSLRTVHLSRGALHDYRQAAFQESLAAPFRLLAKTGNLSNEPPALDLNDTRALVEAAARGRAEPAPKDIRLTLRFNRRLYLHFLGVSREAGNANVLQYERARILVGSWFHPRQRWIVLQLDPEDAAILYRALPRHGGLALRI